MSGGRKITNCQTVPRSRTAVRKRAVSVVRAGSAYLELAAI